MSQFPGDTPAFNSPWLWAYDGLTAFQSSTNGSVNVGVIQLPSVKTTNYTYQS